MNLGELVNSFLAARGLKLILVARSEDALKALATRLHLKHGVEVYVAPVDLLKPEAAEILRAFVRENGLTVDLLVNNAGMGVHGRFLDTDYKRLQAELTLNVNALMDLTHVFLPSMKVRRFGGIVNVASTAALQPVPYMAVYGATKAFVLSFSEALAEEFRDSGVIVQALCTGNTETPFHSKVGEANGQVGNARTPKQVVETSLRALGTGARVAIDGSSNRLLAILPRLLPRNRCVYLL